MKLRFFSIALILVLFISCAEVEHDQEKPVISNVRLNIRDTLMYAGKVIRINVDSLNPDPNRIDTLVIGKMIYLSATLRDDMMLSSYTTRLDSIATDDREFRAFTFIKSGININNPKDGDRKHFELKRQQVIIIPDSISTPVAEGKTKVKGVRSEEYKFTVRCIGANAKEGDTLHVSSSVHRVKLFTRKELYELRK